MQLTCGLLLLLLFFLGRGFVLFSHSWCHVKTFSRRGLFLQVGRNIISKCHFLCRTLKIREQELLSRDTYHTGRNPSLKRWKTLISTLTSSLDLFLEFILRKESPRELYKISMLPNWSRVEHAGWGKVSKNQITEQFPQRSQTCKSQTNDIYCQCDRCNGVSEGGFKSATSPSGASNEVRWLYQRRVQRMICSCLSARASEAAQLVEKNWSTIQLPCK